LLLHGSAAGDGGGAGPVVGAVVDDGSLVVADGRAGVADAVGDAVADVHRRARKNVERADRRGDGVGKGNRPAAVDVYGADGVGGRGGCGAGLGERVDPGHRAGAGEGVALRRVVDRDVGGLDQPLDVDRWAV